MIEEISNTLKVYFEYVFIGVGTLIVIGSILDWKWLYLDRNKFFGIRTFIEETRGRDAVRKFERFVFFIAGIILMICGIIYLLYYKN